MNGLAPLQLYALPEVHMAENKLWFCACVDTTSYRGLCGRALVVQSHHPGTTIQRRVQPIQQDSMARQTTLDELFGNSGGSSPMRARPGRSRATRKSVGTAPKVSKRRRLDSPESPPSSESDSDLAAIAFEVPPQKELELPDDSDTEPLSTLR